MKPAIVLALLACAATVQADPLLSSWYTANSGKYARVYTNAAALTAGKAATTWTSSSMNGDGGQSLPTYAGVHEIDDSTNWVYIKNSGLASYVMGPWMEPNVPLNQGTNTLIYRFPRGTAGVTNAAATKTLTPMGSIGFLVDGVAMYNTSDGYSYSVAHAEDASPTANIGPGDGIWNRDAWVNEYVSFDTALNHSQMNGQYHSHANPIAVRYLLGDNVNYDSATDVYSENTNTAVFTHSPIIGWLNDGLPIYGPYGYSDPMDATSPVRRMVSGYVQRNGDYGTTNLGVTGRTTLPAWAAAAENRSAILTSSEYGPSTNYTTGSGMTLTTYTLGHYAEDYDYLGDLGYTQGATSTVTIAGIQYTAFFDLNKYNARYCVTPDYPNGTWAYFVSIQADSEPWYPYSVGRWFMDAPSGGSTNITVMNADTPLTQYFKGATYLQEQMSGVSVNAGNGDVILTWSAVQGGTYQISTSSNLSTWTNLTPTVTATNNSVTTTETGATTQQFYRTIRTGVATYDSNGY